MRTIQAVGLGASLLVALVGCTADLPDDPIAQVTEAASSNDYPGPCRNESTAPGTPQYLSVDIRTRPVDARIITLPAPGRFRLGISCVYTDFRITRLGDGQTVFEHRCNKHGFGWYDAVNLPAGTYRAVAEARRFDFNGQPLVNGHGTMDTYAYTGNGGAFQPVNCDPGGPAPVGCGDGTCNGQESCGTCAADCGVCPTSAPWNCHSPTAIPVDAPICAQNTGKACLLMQSDGNLVVYDENGAPRWASNTAGNPGSTAAFQGDGNLVVHRPDGQPAWASNTASSDPANANYLCVQDDGNVVMYKWPRAAWATNTSH